MRKISFILVLSILLGLSLTSWLSVPSNNRLWLKADSLSKMASHFYSNSYLLEKDSIMKFFSSHNPGKFSDQIPEIKTRLNTHQKIIALTLDACDGGEKKYNEKLINYLKQEKIPATLFISGKWLNYHQQTLKKLGNDTLFEIANHGLFHRICSTTGMTKYGLIPTRNIGDVIDEIELNARRIKEITGKRPRFFRPAGIYTDELSCKIAEHLGMKVISYSILPGDADKNLPVYAMTENILNSLESGNIILMHLNHPYRHEEEVLARIYPYLKSKGYHFVKLRDYPLQ
jgi:peptidoglycan/xylan/chitin deacetylase (PgdA/CDA1 family)